MNEVPAPVRRHYVDGPYGQVHLRRADPPEPGGRPIVCFHQTPHSSRTYEAFLSHIGRDRIAVALDTPGYGQSDPPPQPLSIAEYAAAHGEVVDALGLGEIDVVGTHTGSRMAVELALQRPAQVRHLVLVGASVYSPEERVSKRRYTDALHVPTENDDEGAQVQRAWQMWASARWPGMTDTMIEHALSHLLHDRARAGWALEGVYAHDLGARLPLLEQPVLVINVRDDIYEQTKRAEGLLQRGRLVELPAGFGVVEAKAAEVAALVREFLSADWQPPSQPR